MRWPQVERLGMGSGPQSEGRRQRTACQYTLANRRLLQATMLLTTATTAAVDDADDDDDDYCGRRHVLWTYAQQHSDTPGCAHR